MRRSWARWLLAAVGALVAALGVLWFAQGVGLVRLDPIACVGACEPVTAPSPTWIAVGALTAVGGLAVMGLALRRRPRR